MTTVRGVSINTKDNKGAANEAKDGHLTQPSLRSSRAERVAPGAAPAAKTTVKKSTFAPVFLTNIKTPHLQVVVDDDNDSDMPDLVADKVIFFGVVH